MDDTYNLQNKTDNPLFNSYIHAGFPSPADDYIDKSLDFNELLITHTAATFCLKVKGKSMIDLGITEGDIVIVDKSIQAVNGNLVVACINGEFTLKMLRKGNESVALLSANPDYPPIEIGTSDDFSIFGVVTFVIHSYG